MDRRDFLDRSGQLCAAMLAIPALAGMGGCAAARPATAFTEADGRVQLPGSMLAQGPVVLRPKGLDDPLWIGRDADGAPVALVLRCPHKGGPVKEQGGVLTCAWHGSTFNAQGAVTKGPSKEGLRRLPARMEGEQVVVDLPRS
ncbi:MAG: Rieske (2Fe-2S) protein [Flavobacteriales bacterium]|nr:Rieske (2Fe-2S) protein [Flavobacteriales bacterium]